jgi:hypothetical protein
MRAKLGASTSSSSFSEPVDLNGILAHYKRQPRQCDFYQYSPSTDTSDSGVVFSQPSRSDQKYWGTPQDWKVLNAEALSEDEFDEIAEILRSSGEASA